MDVAQRNPCYLTVMSVIDRLHALEPTLRSAGLTALYLFGSAARLDTGQDSDVDLLFESDAARRFSLIDQARVRQDLSDELGAAVDLIERQALRPAIRARIEAEMTRIF